MDVAYWIGAVVVAFLSGSIPFAVLIGKAKGIDIRTIGSGNPGASNLGRALGKRWGVLCFLLDAGKGFLPTVMFVGLPFTVGLYTAWRSGHHLEGWSISTGDVPTLGVSFSIHWVSVAVATVLGHVFSPWLGFKGGKGVATGLGATLGLFPIVTVPALLAFVVWYITAKLSGYVGLASVFAAASLPPMTLVSGLIVGLTLGEIGVFVGLTAALAALVIVRHTSNLRRIAEGTEAKAEWTGRAKPE